MEKNVKPADTERAMRIFEEILEEDKEIILALKEYDGEFSGDALYPINSKNNK